MKAQAINLGNGKEKILVDGVEFLKSVKIGKWSHIIDYSYGGIDEGKQMRNGKKIYFDGRKHVTLKSSSAAKAAKANVSSMCIDVQREIVEIER